MVQLGWIWLSSWCLDPEQNPEQNPEDVLVYQRTRYGYIFLYLPLETPPRYKAGTPSYKGYTRYLQVPRRLQHGGRSTRASVHLIGYTRQPPLSRVMAHRLHGQGPVQGPPILADQKKSKGPVLIWSHTYAPTHSAQHTARSTQQRLQQQREGEGPSLVQFALDPFESIRSI